MCQRYNNLVFCIIQCYDSFLSHCYLFYSMLIFTFMLIPSHYSDMLAVWLILASTHYTSICTLFCTYSVMLTTVLSQFHFFQHVKHQLALCQPFYVYNAASCQLLKSSLLSWILSNTKPFFSLSSFCSMLAFALDTNYASFCILLLSSFFINIVLFHINTNISVVPVHIRKFFFLMFPNHVTSLLLGFKGQIKGCSMTHLSIMFCFANTICTIAMLAAVIDLRNLFYVMYSSHLFLCLPVFTGKV